MHRFIALRELQSGAGRVKPGEFLTDLEGATYGIQAALVRRCGVYDLSGAITIDAHERSKVRWQSRLVEDLKAAGTDVAKLAQDYAKANATKDESLQVKRKAKPKAEKPAVAAPKKKAAASSKGRGRK